MALPFVSVVIPVLNEAASLSELLSSFEPDSSAEIIVVNGAPDDEAMRPLRATFDGVVWLESARGRGRQMNEGAWHAQGEWLLFLHVDTRLSAGWIDEIRRADRSGAVGGSFRLRLDSPVRMARVIEWGVGQRVRWFDLPYGDQALFVRRIVFETLSGYREIALMEDVDFVRRLRRQGRLMRSELPAVTSARRWEQDGWICRSAENVVLMSLFTLGVSPETLARIYYRSVIPHERAARLAAR